MRRPGSSTTTSPSFTGSRTSGFDERPFVRRSSSANGLLCRWGSLAAESRGDQFGVEVFGDFLDLAIDHFIDEAIVVVVGLAGLGLAAGRMLLENHEVAFRDDVVVDRSAHAFEFGGDRLEQFIENFL